MFNTFEYFEVNSPKHNNEHDLVDTSDFDKLINNLCNNKKDMTECLMNYIAHMFQYPHINPQKIICLKGWTGTGKDTLFVTLQKLMGHKYVGTTGDIESVFGGFNQILSCKIALFLNELKCL